MGEGDEMFGIAELKNAVNSLLWQHLPGEMTLSEAEVIACDIVAYALDRIESLRSDYTPQGSEKPEAME